jgi:hypothetical protein
MLIALPVAIGVFSMVLTHIGHSFDADTFARSLDPVRTYAMLLAYKKGTALLLPALGGQVLLWAVVSTYATGATLSAVHGESKTSTHELLEGGGRVFGRMLRLLALSAPLWLLIVGGIGYCLYWSVGELTKDWISEQGVVFARLVAVAIAGVVVCWATGACDLMRVEAVARDERRARVAFVRGLLRALKRPISLIALAAPFVLGGALVTVLFSLLDVRIERNGAFTIAMGLLLQQSIVFLRLLLRSSALGSASRFEQ